MYIEVIHDVQGNIVSCYQADTLPEKMGEPLFIANYDILDAQGKPTGQKTKALPAGQEQIRVNIDTLTAMEIDENSGPQAVINSVTGLPEIKRIDRTEYIMQTFKVDVTGPEKIPVKPLKNIPVGMKIKGLVRK